jgi:hypothetical protein
MVAAALAQALQRAADEQPLTVRGRRFSTVPFRQHGLIDECLVGEHPQHVVRCENAAAVSPQDQHRSRVGRPEDKWRLMIVGEVNLVLRVGNQYPVGLLGQPIPETLATSFAAGGS